MQLLFFSEQVQMTKPNAETVLQECEDSTNKSGSVLGENLSVSELRLLIKEWVASEMLPQHVDVQMMYEYLQELVMKRDLTTLDLVIKCLYR